MRQLTILLLVSIFSSNGFVSAKELTLAVVPKFESVFFTQSKIGCEAAAKELPNVKCIYVSPGEADIRTQDKIVKKLIADGVDGIAIAVGQSKFLAGNSLKQAKQAGIPIVTYDSDFDAATLKKYPDLRSAYIGTNNFELGKALGEQLQINRPNGGALVIQSGRPDSPNLNLRIMGIRSALSGNRYDSPPGTLLTGENGWIEVRKPFFNFDQLPRAVKQLDTVLKGKRVQADAFVSVGGWLQNDEKIYRDLITPYKKSLTDNKISIVISDASATQLVLLGDKLTTANVGQSPYEMGRQAILTLYKIINNQPYQEFIYTPLNICTQQNYKTCTKKD
ncbi:substrate-binding domain-containing protein [Vibrio marisflavi]|nr:substrate-binding domain-containing protein [Vibrio marisflavi]